MACIGVQRFEVRRTWLFKPLFMAMKALCWLGIVHPARGAKFVTKHGVRVKAVPAQPQNPPKAK